MDVKIVPKPQAKNGMRTDNIDCALTAIYMTCSNNALLFVAELITHILRVPGEKAKNKAAQTVIKITKRVSERMQDNED